MAVESKSSDILSPHRNSAHLPLPRPDIKSYIIILQGWTQLENLTFGSLDLSLLTSDIANLTSLNISNTTLTSIQSEASVQVTSPM